MGTQRFNSEFKEEAVRLSTERGYSLADVSEHPLRRFSAVRLWIS